MELLTIILASLGSGGLATIIVHIFNRRVRHAETRLKNAEADKNELSNKRDEVAHYRSVINDLVKDMEALRVTLATSEKEAIGEMQLLRHTQEAAQERYEERVGGLRENIEELATQLKKANESLDKANKTIDELKVELKKGSDKTNQLGKELDRANEALDTANEEIKGLRQEVKEGNNIITSLRQEITELMVDRAEKK